MSLNVKMLTQGEKKVTFTGDRSYNVQDVDKYRFSGKDNYLPVNGSISNQTVSIGGTKDVDISSAFTDLDTDRYDSISIGVTSDDETLCVVTLTSSTNVRLFGVAAGTATITLTGKDLEGETDTLTFDAVVS